MAPFRPTGPTVTVDGTARQVSSTGPTGNQQYRVRNVNGAAAYFAWSTASISSGVAPTMSVTAPVAGTPQANVIGMLATSVEVFTLPVNAWFLAGAGTFEVTPGEGE
jgi:hypothetical protein